MRLICLHIPCLMHVNECEQVRSNFLAIRDIAYTETAYDFGTNDMRCMNETVRDNADAKYKI